MLKPTSRVRPDAECFGRAGSRLRIAADKAERLILRHEKFDEFVANGAACSEDSDHSNPSLERTELLNAQNGES
jgi:hypothetical protein